MDVRTDLIAAIEFTEARVEVQDVATQERIAIAGEDWSEEPRRVARFSNLKRGTLAVSAFLREGDTVVLYRRVLVDLQGNTGITIVLSRQCLGELCPGDCLGGQCVEPRCVDGFQPSCQMLSCSRDTDCSPPTGGCAASHCVGGVCLVGQSQCPATQYCDPDDGCLEIPRDSGVDEADAGIRPMDSGVDAASPSVDADSGVDAPSSVDVGPADAGDPVSEGLLLHLPLDDNSLGLRDVVSGEIVGPIHGASSTAGVVGGALLFDGIDDDAVVTPEMTADIGDQYTLALFVRPDALASVGRAFVTCELTTVLQFAYGVDFTDTLWGLAFRADEPDWPNFGVFAEGVLEQSAWHHVALVVDGVRLQLFVDGTTQGDRMIAPPAPPVGPGSGLCYLGQTGWSWSRDWFTGAIDDVRLYGRALDAAELQMLASQ